MHTPSKICLDIFGQQPRLNIYTQICLCFSTSDDVEQSVIVKTLTLGLKRLTASFPWVGGRVVCEGAGDGKTGIFKIEFSGKPPSLVVKDLRPNRLAPTMQDLKQANFLMNLLDENVVAPRVTFSGADLIQESDPDSPVFLVQANFITGGLIVTFLGQHQAMDMTGQGQIMHLLSKACHGEQFTAEELSFGNLSRENIIPLLENYQLGPELSRHLAAPKSPRENIHEDGKQRMCSWGSFVLRPESLRSLKSIALETLPPDRTFVSTDDALSAFVWQSIMRARFARLSPEIEVTFARAIDVRRYVNVPASYPGLVQNMTYTTQLLQNLVKLPLGEIASMLRWFLEPETTILPFHTRALASHLHSQSDKSGVSPVSSLDLSVDVALSSWAKTNCYDLNFNLGLGLPEAVRRPRFTPLEGFVYFMPRARNGKIALAMCLEEQDMERLKLDDVFTRYARYDG